MNSISRMLTSGAIALLCACTKSNPDPVPAAAGNADAAKPAPPAHYAMEDFAHARKLDAHVHVNVTDPAFLEQARDDGFELMLINVDYPGIGKFWYSLGCSWRR